MPQSLSSNSDAGLSEDWAAPGLSAVTDVMTMPPMTGVTTVVGSDRGHPEAECINDPMAASETFFPQPTPEVHQLQPHAHPVAQSQPQPSQDPLQRDHQAAPLSLSDDMEESSDGERRNGTAPAILQKQKRKEKLKLAEDAAQLEQHLQQQQQQQ